MSLDTYLILYKYKNIIQNGFYKIKFQLSNYFIFSSTLINLSIYFSDAPKEIRNWWKRRWKCEGVKESFRNFSKEKRILKNLEILKQIWEV